MGNCALDKDNWNGCTLCSFGALAKNKVWLRGKETKPDVLFIGEAPGKSEDRSGKPFVGAAGKLLDEQLASWRVDGITHTMINALLCRPTNMVGGVNRKPTPLELLSCSARLQAQIAEIAPVYAVVLLGKTAKKAYELFGALPLPAFELWHPAYLLRRGKKSAEYKQWVDSFRKVAFFVARSKNK